MTIRIHQLAKDLGISSKELIEKLHELHVDVKGHMSSVDDETAEIVKHELEDALQKAKAPAKKPKASAKESKTPAKEPKAPAKAKTRSKARSKKDDVSADSVAEEPKDLPAEEPAEPSMPVLEVTLPLTVKEFSVKLRTKPSELIKRLIQRRLFATINQILPDDVIVDIAKEYGFAIKETLTAEEVMLEDHEVDDASQLVSRAPVVTLMGHVDHGKTSLLDVIRKSHVTEKESGGMTQHIGAYEVMLDKGKVAFLDTPGHAAFTAMRARGAHATDVVVLVVAADDGLMPQTIEAIDHARAANVPLVVAINKCDLPGANIDRVKQQLSDHDLTPEDWGGATITVPVSAKTGEGIDTLLEMLLLESELLELKANPKLRASGIVVEAKLSKGKGSVATVLIKNGTLRLGDNVVAGPWWGRVKALTNDHGKPVSEAGPSTPVEISGLNGIPQAGDEVYVVPSEQQAKQIFTMRQDRLKKAAQAPIKKISLEDLYTQIQAGEVKELKIILKADVQGSLEVLADALNKLSTSEVCVVMLHLAVGDINESDVMLAAASNAVIIGFHVGVETAAYAASKREGVEIKLYRIIYEAIDEVKQALEGFLDPHIERVTLGKAEVLQVFKVTKVGMVAGCRVRDGVIVRSTPAKVSREGQSVYEGKVVSLKRFKDDVKEVKQGFECGIILDGYKDIVEGDIIEAYEVKKTARTL